MSTRGQNFEPKDWHAEVSGPGFGYVSNFRYGLGFDVSFRADDDCDRIFGHKYWQAELIHWPATGELPEAAILHRLRRDAVHVFLRTLRAVERRLAALRRVGTSASFQPPASQPIDQPNHEDQAV